MRQAREVHLGSNDLRRLVAANVVRRVVRGVYVSSEVDDGLDLRAGALALVVPRDCFVADRTAAWLHGAPMALAPDEHLAVPRVSFFRPSDRGRLRNGISVSGERDVSRVDLMRVRGLWVTTPLRTAWDLGRLQTRDVAMAGMDALAARGLVSVADLCAGVERFRGQRGVVQLRCLAPLTDPGSQSFGESALKLRWNEASLPRPLTQIAVSSPRHGTAFLDLGVLAPRFAAEYDGERWHRDHVADGRRRAWIAEEHGFHIEVFRREHVFGHHQDAIGRLRTSFIEACRRAGIRPPRL